MKKFFYSSKFVWTYVILSIATIVVAVICTRPTEVEIAEATVKEEKARDGWKIERKELGSIGINSYSIIIYTAPDGSRYVSDHNGICPMVKP